MGYSQRIKSNHIMEHHGNGESYLVLFRAIDMRNYEIVLVYQALYGDKRVFARPIGMFDTWFEKETGSVPRFRILSLKVTSNSQLIESLLAKQQTIFHTEDEIEMVLVEDESGFVLQEKIHASAS